ncbi:MAG: PGPGW domain-containing protein [Actinomycetota bacterium]|nr:PGPGW domain-containing protein [Actinomycetota bacterium]
MAERGTHPTIEKLRERRERHKQRHVVYRFGFATAGVLLILAGLLLSLPGIPGPGLLVAAIGLGMLALEWDPAERLLERVLRRIDDAREASRSVQFALAAVVVLAAAGAFVLTALLWDVPLLPL